MDTQGCPQSLWTLIVEHVPQSELPEVRGVLGDALVDMYTEMYSEVEMWRQIRQDVLRSNQASRPQTPRSPLADPPAIKELLKAEIQLLLRCVRERAAQDGRDGTTVMSRYSPGVVGYALGDPGGGWGSVEPSLDAASREQSPHRARSSSRSSVSSSCQDEVEAVKHKLNVTGIDQVVAHLKSVLTDECDALKSQVTFLQDSVEREHLTRRVPEAPDPTVTELKEERRVIQKDLELYRRSQGQGKGWSQDQGWGQGQGRGSTTCAFREDLQPHSRSRAAGWRGSPLEESQRLLTPAVTPTPHPPPHPPRPRPSPPLAAPPGRTPPSGRTRGQTPPLARGSRGPLPPPRISPTPTPTPPTRERELSPLLHLRPSGHHRTPSQGGEETIHPSSRTTTSSRISSCLAPLSSSGGSVTDQGPGLNPALESTGKNPGPDPVLEPCRQNPIVKPVLELRGKNPGPETVLEHRRQNLCPDPVLEPCRQNRESRRNSSSHPVLADPGQRQDHACSDSPISRLCMSPPGHTTPVGSTPLPLESLGSCDPRLTTTTGSFHRNPAPPAMQRPASRGQSVPTRRLCLPQGDGLVSPT